MMEKIAVIGAGGFGREVQMLIEQINAIRPVYEIIGFYDDGKVKGEIINGLLVLGKVEDINKIEQPLSIALGIGAPAVKKKIIKKISNPLISFPNLIHPSVQIGFPYVTLGKGNVLCGNNILTVNIDLGDFVTLNLGCTVGHDTRIGDYSAFMPGCDIAGEVVIQPLVYGGLGTKIINLTNVGTNVTLGAGAVVTKDIPDNSLAVGIPAKVIKTYET